MKRKIFSKLLMVALVIAAVGSFVSCKDYDDDINNLQKQIDAKAALSELTALQSTLDSKIAAAQSAATAAQAKADAAATKTSVDELKKALETAIADAKKAGTDAGTQAGTAIAAANKAQETADAAAAAAKKADEDAKAALADALKTIEETYQTKAEAAAAAAEAAEALADVKAIADAAYTKAQAEKLQEQVNNLKSDLESAIEEKVKEAIKDVQNAKASVDAIWSAVTSIEFVVDQWGVVNNSDILNFQFGKQLDNVFGNGKELHAYDVTDKPETYTAGKDIKAENVYFVRVSPVNADLSDANLKLVNSLGEDLSEFVNIKVEAFKELLTRAAETGLWKVTVTLKDGVDREKLQKAATVKLSRDKKRTISSAVYAIAAGNTESEDDRFAVTTYDLQVWTNDYTPIDNLDFEVNDVNIANIYNRWDFADKYVVAEDGSKEKDSLYWELAWNTPEVAEKFNFDVPAVKAITNIAFDAKGKPVNNYVPANDDRRGMAKLQVQPEEQIVIKFNVRQYPYVDRYYVQFDKDNAVESAPSEFESWLSYNATGLFTMKKASERLILTVPADAAEGDIIGFRLYAVNYDGTLVDPDGKAFYVQVGFVPNADESDILTGTYTAREAALENPGAKTIIQNKANAVIIPFDMAAKYPSLYKGTEIEDAVADAAQVDVDPDKEQNENFITDDGTSVDVYYLKSDKLDAEGNAQEAKTVGEVKFIALNVQNPENIIDGETVETNPLKIFDPDKHDKVVGYLSFMLKKGDIVPNAVVTDNDKKIDWKSGYDGTFYPQLNADTWNALFVSPANNEEIDLTKYATGLENYSDLSKYKWTLKKITYDADKEADFKQPVLDFTAQKLTGSNSKDQATNAKAAETDATTFKLTATPTMVEYNKVVKIIISDYEGVAGLSRKDLENDPEPGSAHEYQTLTLKFKDIWSAQTYKNTQTYEDGTVGAAIATVAKKEQTFFVKNGDGPVGLRAAWKSYVAGTGDDANKIKTAAVKDYDITRPSLTLGAILGSSTNSVYESFYTGAFNVANYVGFAEYDFDGDEVIGVNDYAYYVKSADGKVNEYVTPYVLPTVDNMNDILGNVIRFAKSDNAPELKKKTDFTLVIEVVDAFGISHPFSVPFELIP